MEKGYCFLILVTIAGLSVFAESLPQKCEVFLPADLNRSIICLSAIEKLSDNSYGQNGSSTGKYWDVYSDRCDNIVYNGPNTSSGTTGKTIAFNQKVRIAKIENGFALVYIENKPAAVNYPQLSSDCKAVGWVPMDNLLLWSSCPTNDVGIYRKAFPQSSLDDWGVNNNMNDTKRRLIYDNPTNKSNPQIIPDSTEFFFVMKEDKECGMVLLSKRNTLFGKTSQVLYGWIDKDSYIPWDGRVCLEPNWKNEVAEKLKDTSIGIYQNERKIQNVTLGKANNLGQETTKYRMLPNEMRFPVLDENDNQYRVITFIKPNGLTNDALNNNKVVATIGNTDKKDSKTGFDYWQPVIYISNAEYNDLIGKLQPIMDAAEESRVDRRPYLEAMKVLIRTLYGNIGEKDMMSMDTRKIMAHVAGLNVKSESIKGRTLEQIQDNKVVSQEEFTTMIDNFKLKFRKLDRIKSGYKYSIKVVGDTWYWIPVEDLP